MREPRVESVEHYRVPSQYKRCRMKIGFRLVCHEPPAADMRRSNGWWAYCAEHWRCYNREVRDGQVWWLGFSKVTA